MIDVFEAFGKIETPKRRRQLIAVIKTLSKSEKPLTIPGIADITGNSIPTITALLDTLQEKEWVLDLGKKDTDSGRRPNIYSINRDKVFAVGVTLNFKGVHLVIARMDGSVRFSSDLQEFELENNEEALKRLESFIKKSITRSKVPIESIMGLGLGLTGRINSKTGESLNYFNFMDKPLQNHLEDVLKMPVIVDNDTRALGFAEQEYGKGRGIDNAIYVYVDRGLGMSMVFNGEILRGGNGYAGEFGHMKFGKKNRLCLCGKRGCLGTEVSGYALVEDLKEALAAGEESLFFSTLSDKEYKFQDILDAAIKGDHLCIDLLQQQGNLLGMALGNVINLLNPETIVVCGEIVIVREPFMDALKNGLHRTVLMHALNSCSIKVSTLGSDAAARGAAAMVIKKYDLA